MRRLVLVVVLVACTVQNGQAKDLGTFGRTYPIVERDALEETRERAGQVDWRAVMRRIRPEAYRPKGLKRLPRAGEDRTFLVDMTYTLPFDIPDGKGGVLYPRGYQFNPLDYVPFNQTLVVFNGDDADQVAWLRESGLLEETGTVLILSGGSYVEMARDLARPVYYLNPQIVDRFHLRAVPSVVRRMGKMMEVKEFKVEGGHGEGEG
ncbi:conjugal transfer pilus assembly protein TraW [Geothermobacter ehrlichii]|uniref:Conjugal transfer pilus assembly protein TraW n=1 Tax=Geothermobacter ehrlichii TaxID=213224 RepID=A0A5D3WHI6_9BACT|nr:hypothetical protein [Geothermobacter ehrlichii]TYO96786.1 conjugal transfer pilus assembly protein TraW [Geothermobacter ehrlichii]